MMKMILHKLVSRFERQANYDSTYWHEIIDVSPGAALKLAFLPMLSQHRGPAPEVWAGAALASVLDGDCGPCAQLVVDSAISTGVSPEKLAAAARNDFTASGDVGLGFRFAQASINDDETCDALRQEIRKTHGDEAVIAAAYAAATARAYPVLKAGPWPWKGMPENPFW